MYHSIVKRIARKNFLRVNDKDYDALLKDCALDIHHRFGGNHALGGERHSRDALRQWFGRLGRLAEHLTITVEDIWVKGLPHDTVIIIRWSATDRLRRSPKPLRPSVEPTPTFSPYRPLRRQCYGPLPR
jgi:ketosteroid isomerase-like protein